jgi:hypothetical protein
MGLTDCSSNEHLISKVYFPRLIVHTAAVVVAFRHPRSSDRYFVIEDGSQISSSHKCMYVIENLHWQDDKLEKKDEPNSRPKSRSMFKQEWINCGFLIAFPMRSKTCVMLSLF